MKGVSIMNSHPSNGSSETRSTTAFFLLVFLLSVPFWAMGPVVERFLPMEQALGLPFSSLAVVTPAVAAVVLILRQKGSDAAKELLKRALDYGRIRRKAWLVPILLFWPAVMVLQYGWLKAVGVPLPPPRIPVLMVPVSFAVFSIAALGEEIGWQGYAVDPLQRRWNALASSVLLGMVWAGWHLVPLAQAGRAPDWIAWQCLTLVVARIIVVWLYSNTGKSVFAAILFHAMCNVSTVLLPGYGWHYDPRVGFGVLAVTAAIITYLWGPKTLARFRYAPRGRPLPARAAGRTAGR
jgi:membrane protease YdiL (CAAX protease family)